MIRILRRLAWLLLALAFVTAFGTIMFETVEGLSYFDAFYLTVVSITTVGYGDIVPHTVGGRILAMFLVVTGFTIFTGTVVTSTRLMFERRDNIRMEQQVNTLMSLFFTEIGDKMLRLLCLCDLELQQFWSVTPPGEWTAADFSALAATLEKHTFDIDPDQADWATLRKMLDNPLLLQLLENPQVFANTLFNHALRATFHLKDEMGAYPGLDFPADARAHVAKDAREVYQPMVQLWLEHMNYLKKEYPVLFLTALKANPFGVASPLSNT